MLAIVVGKAVVAQLRAYAYDLKADESVAVYQHVPLLTEWLGRAATLVFLNLLHTGVTWGASEIS